MFKQLIVGIVGVVGVSGCNCGPTSTVPSGFSQVYAGADAEDGLHVSLVLDKDDLPMVAFLKVDQASPANNAVYFTRYDGAAWKTPVVVAAGVGRVDSNATMRQVWLARDASTGRLGVAFQKFEAFCVGSNDETTVHVSYSTDQGATWTSSERVSEAKYTRNDPVNGVEVCNTTSPRIAMANGTVHVAWAASAGEQDGIGFITGYYYASSTAPGTWSRTLLPHVGDDGRKGRTALSLALDSTGAPAVAYLMLSLGAPVPNNTAIVYVRPGSAAVRVADSANVQNDAPQVTLAFDGTKPRVGALLTRSTADREATWVFRSDDGAAFTETRVPDDAEDKGGRYLDLMFQSGKGVLAADFSGSGARGQCGGPKLSRSSDAASWTTCGADDQTHQFLGTYVSGELAGNGKVILAFHTVNADTASPSRFGRGIVLWREP